MLASNSPTKFPIPFAANAGGGYIATIPQASQIGISAGRASLNDGFVPLNFTPIAGGGTPYFGQDLNGILKQTTEGLRWLQSGGLPAYDAAFCVAIGGYPSGAMIIAKTGANFWRSSVDDNLTCPDAAAGSYAGGTGGSSSVTLTISGVTSGVVTVGQIIYGTGITAGTTITALGTGTGGNGTYVMSVANNIAPGTTITATGSANWVSSAVTIVSATNAVQGIVRLATSAETITGTDNTTAVTPADLASLTSSTTRMGIVRLATSAETIAGTSSTLAVTPADLAVATVAACTGNAATATNGVVTTNIKTVNSISLIGSGDITTPDSTTSVKGKIQLATTAEGNTGTDTAKAIVPSSLAANKRVCKAWVNFDGTQSGTITPRDSFNVTSVTKNATGDYTVNITNAMTDTNYAPVVTGKNSASSTFVAVVGINDATKTSTACRVGSTNMLSNAVDNQQMSVAIYGS